MQVGSYPWWEVIIAGICTLAIYSFLYRENPVYRFFEHIFIGIATAWGLVATVRNYLWPKILRPLSGFDRIPYPDGSYAEPYNSLFLLYLLPIAFGLLYYFILSRKYNWIAQIVIGFQLGVAGGLAFKGTFTELLPQLFDSFRPVFVPGDIYSTLSNLVFLLTLLTALAYFFFSFKRTPGGVVAVSSSIGRWMMMGCFGAFFGSTIMARMALLVNRLDFLLRDWWDAIREPILVYFYFLLRFLGG